MTEAESIVADIIIEKCPERLQFSLSGFMSGNLLLGKQDIYEEEIYKEIVQIVNSRNSVIRTFLLKEEYFETTNHSIPYDILTKKGEKAKELGGHKNYKEWEAEQERKKAIEDFPKKKWYISEPLKYLISLIIGVLIGHFTCNKNNAQSNNQATQKTKTDQPKPKVLDTSNKKQ